MLHSSTTCTHIHDRTSAYYIHRHSRHMHAYTYIYIIHDLYYVYYVYYVYVYTYKLISCMSELLSNTNTDFGPHFQLLHHCWKVIHSEGDEGSPPYFNNKTTGETTWDHPPGDSVEEKCSFVVTLCVSSGKICEFFIGRGIRVDLFWGFDGLGLVREIGG